MPTWGRAAERADRDRAARLPRPGPALPRVDVRSGVRGALPATHDRLDPGRGLGRPAPRGRPPRRRGHGHRAGDLRLLQLGAGLAAARVPDRLPARGAVGGRPRGQRGGRRAALAPGARPRPRGRAGFGRRPTARPHRRRGHGARARPEGGHRCGRVAGVPGRAPRCARRRRPRRASVRDAPDATGRATRWWSGPRSRRCASGRRTRTTCSPGWRSAGRSRRSSTSCSAARADGRPRSRCAGRCSSSGSSPRTSGSRRASLPGSRS